MRRFVFIAFAFVMMLGRSAPAADITPGELLAEVAKKYREMDTYESEGTITSDIDTGNMKMTMETTFTVRLKKPNLFLITWTQKMPMGGMEMPGAVWHDGTQNGFYMGAMNTWSVMKDESMALAAATGVSGGAANTIPKLFMTGLEEMMDPFFMLDEPVMEEEETIDGEECYVISASSIVWKKITYWISKSDRHIVKFAHSLEPPEGEKLEIPEMTDEMIEETLGMMGEEVTEESKKRIRDMMDQSREMMEEVKLKGLSTEQHAKISSPELSAADFRYELPKDAKRRDSLLNMIPNPAEDGDDADDADDGDQ